MKKVFRSWVKTSGWIYIADDYLLIREGIKKVIKELSGAILVGETHDLNYLADKISSTRPDILIMELNLC